MFVFYKLIWRTAAYNIHSSLSYHEGILAICHILLAKTLSMGDGCDRQQARHHNNSSAIFGTKDSRGETITNSTKTNKALKGPNSVSTKRTWILPIKQARPTGCPLTLCDRRQDKVPLSSLSQRWSFSWQQGYSRKQRERGGQIQQGISVVTSHPLKMLPGNSYRDSSEAGAVSLEFILLLCHRMHTKLFPTVMPGYQIKKK